MRVAVPSRVRKKTALRVRRSVAVGFVGVGWGGGGGGGWGGGGGGGGGVGMVGRSAVKHKNSGIIKGVDQVSWPQEGFTGWCCKRETIISLLIPLVSFLYSVKEVYCRN